MRYLVIERYRHGPGPVYARVAERGRILADGLVFLDSWIDERSLATCWQLMEAPDLAAFEPWLDAWRDLVDFEIVPVVSSAEAAARASDVGP